MTTARYFSSTILLVISISLLHCADDKTPKPALKTESAPQTPAPTTPVAAQPAAQEPYKPLEDPAGKTVDELRGNKTNRIGTMPTGKDAELNKTLEAPPTKVETQKVARPGPPAYASKKDAVLLAEPASNAAKIATLKQYETVYILETSMTDESGKSWDVPQWYKIQRSDGQKGWVNARFIGLPF